MLRKADEKTTAGTVDDCGDCCRWCKSLLELISNDRGD